MNVHEKESKTANSKGDFYIIDEKMKKACSIKLHKNVNKMTIKNSIALKMIRKFRSISSNWSQNIICCYLSSENRILDSLLLYEGIIVAAAGTEMKWNEKSSSNEKEIQKSQVYVMINHHYWKNVTWTPMPQIVCGHKEWKWKEGEFFVFIQFIYKESYDGKRWSVSRLVKAHLNKKLEEK